MSRIACQSPVGVIFHVLNRGQLHSNPHNAPGEDRKRHSTTANLRLLSFHLLDFTPFFVQSVSFCWQHQKTPHPHPLPGLPGRGDAPRAGGDGKRSVVYRAVSVGECLELVVVGIIVVGIIVVGIIVVGVIVVGVIVVGVIVVGSTKFNTKLMDVPAFKQVAMYRTYKSAPPAVDPVARESQTPAVRPISMKSMFPVRSTPLIQVDSADSG
jgi:hypothetical protein